MKTMTLSLAAVAVLALPSVATAESWKIDTSHTAASFSVRHMMVSTVRGQFSGVSGTVEIDEKNPSQTKIDVTIDVRTVDTGDEKRDQHLLTDDFFAADKYPKATFESTKVKRAKNGAYEILGNLTLRGTTKPVTLMLEDVTPVVKDPWGNFRRGGTATATINRKDFGVNWNAKLDQGGVVVSDEVKLTIDVQLMRPAGKTS